MQKMKNVCWLPQRKKKKKSSHACQKCVLSAKNKEKIKV
jgi:hypothetical protein